MYFPKALRSTRSWKCTCGLPIHSEKCDLFSGYTERRWPYLRNPIVTLHSGSNASGLAKLSRENGKSMRTTEYRWKPRSNENRYKNVENRYKLAENQRKSKERRWQAAGNRWLLTRTIGNRWKSPENNEIRCQGLPQKRDNPFRSANKPPRRCQLRAFIS